jgi:hypothetical protein
LPIATDGPDERLNHSGAPKGVAMLSILRGRTYRHLFAAQILSLIGTGLTTIALGLLAYDLAGADAGFSASRSPSR